MKKLILGYLPKDYSPHKHIVLGPWSFVNEQDLLINGAIFEDDPYNNHLEIKRDAELSIKISNDLISLFAQKLNKHNNTSYSNKYWRVMLSAWVSMLVQITIERYRRIERLIHKYPTDKFKVDLVECNEDWFFNDSLDFVNKGVFDMLFNEWIFSFIIKESFSDQFEINNQSICQIVKEDKHATLRNKLRNYFNLIFPSSTVYRINSFEGLILDSFLLFKKRKIKDNRKIKSKNMKKDSRIRLNWELLLEKTTPQYYKNIIQRKQPNYRRTFLIGGKIYYDEKFKEKIARSYDVGSKIISTQHGSNYGTMDSFPQTYLVEYMNDHFFSWGWEKQSDYNFKAIPLPSPVLSKIKINKTATTDSDGILFVGQFANLFSYRLISGPQPGSQIKIIKEIMSFLDNIREDLGRELIFAPYPNIKNCINQASMINKQYNYIKIKKNILDTYQFKTKLMVIDHPGTAFHQRMVANLPTVGYWDSSIWSFARQSKSYFMKLEESGVIFSSASELAKHINNVWGHLDIWWQDETLQNARAEWCHQYARKDSKWFSMWLQKLKELS